MQALRWACAAAAWAALLGAASNLPTARGDDRPGLRFVELEVPRANSTPVSRTSRVAPGSRTQPPAGTIQRTAATTPVRSGGPRLTQATTPSTQPSAPGTTTPPPIPDELFEPAQPMPDAPPGRDSEIPMPTAPPAAPAPGAPSAAPPATEPPDFEMPGTAPPGLPSPGAQPPDAPTPQPQPQPPRTQPQPPRTPSAPAPFPEALPEPQTQSPPRMQPPPRGAPQTPPSEPAPYYEPTPEPSFGVGDSYGTWDGGGYCHDCEGGMPLGGYQGDCCGPCADGFCGLYDQHCPPKGPLPRPPPGTWVNLDYLMWWGRGQSLPALLTTGSTTGSMADPNVRVLFGNDRVDNDIRSGGRLTVGTWILPDRSLGIAGSYLRIQQAQTTYRAESDGDPLLARPFFDVLTQQDDSILLAASGELAGTFKARTTDDFLAADVHFRHLIACGPCRRLDLIYGYRFVQLNSSLDIFDTSVSIDDGTLLASEDRFRTVNLFNGFQIGLAGERRAGLLSLTSLARLSLGNMRQNAYVDGNTLIEVPGELPVEFHEGLLALGSNIGQFRRDVFAVVPEVNLNLGYQITPRLRTTLGYTLIYVNRVAMAGNQVNLQIDPSQFGGGVGDAPLFRFRQNGYWAQGLNFGISYRF